ncbi:hypothetical protein JCM8097_009104 [Rhodosporidiobolus ruineniae]
MYTLRGDRTRATAARPHIDAVVLSSRLSYRHQHLARLSLVHYSWTPVAQALLFSSLYFDVRDPRGDIDAGEENERWRSRLAGLRMRVEKHKDVTELQVELVTSRRRGVPPWEIGFLLPAFPRLSSLSIIRHGSPQILPPTFNPDLFSSARNLTRLVLGRILLPRWFPDDSFPTLKTLIRTCTSIGSLPHGRIPPDRLFCPFPRLEAAALVGIVKLSGTTFANAPPTLRHLLIARSHQTSHRGDDTDAIVALLASLPTPPISLTAHATSASIGIEGVAAALSSNRLPAQLSCIRRLVLPPAPELGPYASHLKVAAFRTLQRECARRGIKVRHWTEEEGRNWRVEEWEPEE